MVFVDLVVDYLMWVPFEVSQRSHVMCFSGVTNVMFIFQGGMCISISVNCQLTDSKIILLTPLVGDAVEGETSPTNC